MWSRYNSRRSPAVYGLKHPDQFNASECGDSGAGVEFLALNTQLFLGILGRG